MNAGFTKVQGFLSGKRIENNELEGFFSALQSPSMPSPSDKLQK